MLSFGGFFCDLLTVMDKIHLLLNNVPGPRNSKYRSVYSSLSHLNYQKDVSKKGWFVIEI